MDRFTAAARQLGFAGTQISPYRVGGTQIRPYRVGAPAEQMPTNMAPPVQYSPQQYTAGGNSYLGFGRTTIAAGATGVSVQINPIRPFEPLELRCPSTVIGLFIDNITIQGVQFFANRPNVGVPIEVFSEVSLLKEFEAATIQPDTGIEFILSNPTANPLVFSGCFRGTQVRI